MVESNNDNSSNRGGDDGVEAKHFIELECLKLTDNGYEWKEQARWIKLEEDIECGSKRWSKPYLPTAAYKNIQQLKDLLTTSSYFMLDIEAQNLEEISTQICQHLVANRILENEFSCILKATLLARHHHHHHRNHHKHHGSKHNEQNQCHLEIMPTIRSHHTNVVDPLLTGDQNSRPKKIVFLEDSDDETLSSSKDEDSVLRCMSRKARASTILVANVPYVEEIVLVYVRLKTSCILGNLNEISLPVKSLFLVLTPEENGSQGFQLGRTIGILLSDECFAALVDQCQMSNDILSGIEAFMLNGSVFPHGQWDHHLLTHSVNRWVDDQDKKSTKAVLQRRRTTMGRDPESQPLPSDVDPLKRTGNLFGGLVNDIKRKLPHVVSDFMDALNFRCLIAVILIYFSFMAPAIAFAASLSQETDGLMGVSEMIAATSVSGMVFGLFAGQPLIILGATGTLLVMEESIYYLSVSLEIEFLPWRVWIGFWITIFCTLIVAFDLSYLVRKFTLFTEEVVTALIATVFIHESFRYVAQEMSTYYFPYIDSLQNQNTNSNKTQCGGNNTNPTNNNTNNNNNIALPFITIVLMFGTFIVCYSMRKLKHSQFFPTKLRRLVSDFGIAFAVLLFQLFDLLLKYENTPKLAIPEGLTPTSPHKRDWIINAMGVDKKLSPVCIISASIPALFVTILLFMETELTGTIVDRKEYNLKKGSGYNLDLMIVGLLATFSSLLGLPWMCACPVHSISHVNSLTVWNQRIAPGTKPQVEKVIEQRVTNILIHFLIGVSLFLAPLLRRIPIAVLYGVFLYLGITALSHLRLTERIKLLFVHSRFHPDRRFIRKVETKKVHLFTLIQIVCLVIVLVVKSTVLAPAFPFFIVMMVPLRSQLTRFFTEDELEELDTDTMEDLNDENLDEYDIVHVPM